MEVVDQSNVLERKQSGSYYTPAPLVEQLLITALDPVIEKAKNSAQLPPRDALLSLTIIDPACGSGHFLLAAARRLAAAVADVTCTEAVSYADAFRSALGEVICRCIYGVDSNPMAIELCKISLWLEALEPGYPLAFLDAHIQCGDSLVGLLDPALLEEGIPEEAFTALEGDEKSVCTALRKKNRLHKEVQGDLFLAGGGIATLPSGGREKSLCEVQAKKGAWLQWQASDEYQHNKLLADLWTAAFFVPKTSATAELVPLSEDLVRVRKQLPGREATYAWATETAKKHLFFHWHLAFPAIFGKGGFDVVLGNPPWERIKLQEKEFFESSNPQIATAANKAARDRLIAELKNSTRDIDRALVNAFAQAKRYAESSSLFCRTSGRFPLTGIGDVNTYPLFAELINTLINPRGRAGVIVPTGIATDSSTQHFFRHLVEEKRLASLYDFENSQKKWFADVDSRYRFSLLSLSRESDAARLAFMVGDPRELQQTGEKRSFTLINEEFERFNPNTHTCPLFRSWIDAELSKKIYSKAPVLFEEGKRNSWDISFLNMFNMSSDSHFFKVRGELEKEGAFLYGNIFQGEKGEEWLPLLEAKMVHLYDHRWASYDASGMACQDVSSEDKASTSFCVQPRYWVARGEVDRRLTRKGWNRKWLMGWRDITNATNERTTLASLMPVYAMGGTINNLFPLSGENKAICLYASLASLVVDYIARLKIGGTHLNIANFKQLPILPPEAYSDADVAYITPRALELIYTAHDMRPFAEEMGYDGPPFPWDEERRAHLRAELDAYYARLYGLTRQELLYILDPAAIYGEDFPSETFRVLKKKELKQWGEYRTARFVLQAWDRQESQMDDRKII